MNVISRKSLAIFALFGGLFFTNSFGMEKQNIPSLDNSPEAQQAVARGIQYQPRTRMAQQALEGIASAANAAKIPPYMPVVGAPGLPGHPDVLLPHQACGSRVPARLREWPSRDW